MKTVRTRTGNKSALEKAAGPLKRRRAAKPMKALNGMSSPPAALDMSIANVALEVLSPYADRKTPLKLRVDDDTGRLRRVELPALLVPRLLDMLRATTEGREVDLVARDAELTTVQAARLLNVSRPFVIKLLEEGKLPCRKVGSHRRIRTADVMAYKAAEARKSEAAFDRMVADSREPDMGYD